MNVKKMIKSAVVLTTLGLGAASAQASISLALEAGYLFTAGGGSPLPTDSTLVLLVDKDGDGFGNLTQATSSFKGDPDDVILAYFRNGPLPADEPYGPGSASAVVEFELNGIPVGADLLLVWYNTPFLNNVNAGPGGGVSFGTYRTDSVSPDGSIPWEVPADGASALPLTFYTIGLTGTAGAPADSAGYANFTTAAVPEPASLAILAAGVSLMVARRRNRA